MDGGEDIPEQLRQANEEEPAGITSVVEILIHSDPSTLPKYRLSLSSVSRLLIMM